MAPSHKLAGGGQGTVFGVAGHADIVFKRYHDEELSKDLRLEDRITLMRHLDPAGAHQDRSGHLLLAWPMELVYERGRFVGLLMPMIDMRRRVELHRVTDPSDRTDPKGHPGWLREFNWRYLVRVAKNLALGTELLHASGVVIGDFNDRNVAVSNEARVTLFDCDSMQIADPSSGERFLCRVRRSEFLAPELARSDLRTVVRPASSDLFALAVHLHQLLLEGEHPFRGKWRGADDQPKETELAAGGLWAYGGFREIEPRPAAIGIDLLPPFLIDLFGAAFVDGATKPAARPTASDWRVALAQLESSLRQCTADPEHWYSPTSKRCPWCKHETKQKARTVSRQQGLQAATAGPAATAVGAGASALGGGTRTGSARTYAPPTSPLPAAPLVNLRHSGNRTAGRLRGAAVAVAVGGFYAGSYTFSNQAAKPNGLGDGLLWCGSCALLALLVAALFDAVFGPARPKLANRGRALTVLFAAAGLALWGLSFHGPNPSQLGWLAPPLMTALGHGIGLARVGSSRAGSRLRVAAALAGVLVALALASTILGARTQQSWLVQNPLASAFEPAYEKLVEATGVRPATPGVSPTGAVPVGEAQPSPHPSPKASKRRGAHHRKRHRAKTRRHTARPAHIVASPTRSHASAHSTSSADRHSTSQTSHKPSASPHRESQVHTPTRTTKAAPPKPSGPVIEGGAEHSTPAGGGSGIEGSAAPGSSGGGSGSGISGGAG